MNTDQFATIGEMVAEDYRAAAVFSKYGIDFCCKGNRSLEQVCDKKNVDVQTLKNELSNIGGSGDNQIDFKSWPLDLMADYIEKTHHRYIEENTPVIQKFLDKLSRVHGERHPELHQIKSLFDESARDLAAHLKKEELILFPFVRNMVAGKDQRPHFGTVENPVAMMKEEHEAEGERFAKIAELSDNYTTPADGCTTYRVAFSMLEAFEKDLHKHIHLENNILFPRAIAMEKERQNALA